MPGVLLSGLINISLPTHINRCYISYSKKRFNENPRIDPP